MMVTKETRLISLCLGLLLAASHAEIVTLAHPGQTIPANSTVIWSPLFQAAWDDVNSRFAGPLLRVEPPNETMTKLDSFKWDPTTTMPLESWKVWSGPATAEFLRQVNKEASAISKQPDGEFTLPNQPEPNSLAFFGLLEREVKFFREFFRSRKSPLKFKMNGTEHPVEFFGVKGELSGEFDFVEVLEYKPREGSYLLVMNWQASDDKVILYLPAKPDNFAITCKHVHDLRTMRAQNHRPREFGKETDNRIHGGDDIRIPALKFDTKSDLKSQLSGLRFYQGEPLPWLINRAEQCTRFELDSKGARVSARVSGGLEPFGGPIVGVPRKFIFDRPFFVFLWRDEAKWPYFGAWIGDTSALKPFP